MSRQFEHRECVDTVFKIQFFFSYVLLLVMRHTRGGVNYVPGAECTGEIFWECLPLFGVEVVKLARPSDSLSSE